MNNRLDFYTTLTAAPGGTFDAQLHELKEQLHSWMEQHGLTTAALLQTRVYLSDAANQWEQFRRDTLYTHYLSSGAVAYVEQPLLSGAKVGLQLWFNASPGLQKTGTPERLAVRIDGVTLYFHTVRFTAAEAAGHDAGEQTEMAFARHMEWLAGDGLTLERNCHRTWLFVRDIDCNYAAVVAARNKVFGREGLTPDTHFIASTGIGGYPDNPAAAVCVDFLSVAGLAADGVRSLHALDYLNPTHEYGVAFERGTRLRLPGAYHYFISGTASIDRYGRCLYCGDVMRQAERLFLNIDQLLRDGGASLADVAYMVVYLRDIADAGNVRAALDRRFPGCPYLMVEARVCRPEWLIEVECVALRRL